MPKKITIYAQVITKICQSYSQFIYNKKPHSAGHSVLDVQYQEQQNIQKDTRQDCPSCLQQDIPGEEKQWLELTSKLVVAS